MAGAISQNLRLRILSGTVLAPLAIAAIYAGTPWFDALVLLLAVLLSMEWARLAAGPNAFGAGCYIASVSVVSLVLSTVGQPAFGLVLSVLGAALPVALAFCLSRNEGNWIGMALLWITLPCLAVLWLRSEADFGLAITLWLVGVVWLTDIGAYFAGRSIGGPKLAPKISPAKTWAGLCGGVVAAAAVGAIASLSVSAPPIWWLIGVSMVIAVVAQIGDLAQSVIKRHFGVKDSGAIIPGHGGVFDRLDGLLAAAPAVVVFQLATTGGPLTWR